MRLIKTVASSALSLWLSIGLAPPAQAQSFFQKLFGLDSQAPLGTRPRQPAIPAHKFYRRAPLPSQPAEAARDADIGPPDEGGPYRILCVRTCDGFYFPIRDGAWHRNFAPDLKFCNASCSSEGKLYYHPVNGGSIDTMVDLEGTPYSAAPHAFAYRKALAKGCSCRAAPWAKEELARHEQYRVREASQDLAGSSVGASPGAEFEKPPSQAADASADAGPVISNTVREDAAVSVVMPEQLDAERALLRRRPKLRVQGAQSLASGFKIGAGFDLFGGKPKYVRPGNRR